jgi:hypothetical protein
VETVLENKITIMWGACLLTSEVFVFVDRYPPCRQGRYKQNLVCCVYGRGVIHNRVCLRANTKSVYENRLNTKEGIGFISRHDKGAERGPRGNAKNLLIFN